MSALESRLAERDAMVRCARSLMHNSLDDAHLAMRLPREEAFWWAEAQRRRREAWTYFHWARRTADLIDQMRREAA